MPVFMDVKKFPVPEHQADAIFSQVNPISGTKYLMLDITKNCRVIGIDISCVWTVQPSPLEIYITIDSVNYTASKVDPVSAAYYVVYAVPTSTGLSLIVGADAIKERAFLLEGRSIKIEAAITGGTVSSLFGRVKYAKW